MIKREKFENCNMVYKIAWSIHHTTGYDVQELISEATLGYCEALNNFDPARETSKFTTFAYRVIVNKVLDFLRKEKRHSKNNKVSITEEIEETLLSIDVYAMDSDEFMLKIQSWNTDLQFIVRILFAQKQVLNSVPPKIARGLIVDRLRMAEWSWPRIWRTFTELKQALNEI